MLGKDCRVLKQFKYNAIEYTIGELFPYSVCLKYDDYLSLLDCGLIEELEDCIVKYIAKDEFKYKGKTIKLGEEFKVDDRSVINGLLDIGLLEVKSIPTEEVASQISSNKSPTKPPEVGNQNKVSDTANKPKKVGRPKKRGRSNGKKTKRK